MSPQSRRSPSPSGSGSGQRRGAAGPPPNALFAELLRAARELLAVRSPLDAELMVSELLGTWWGQRSGGRRAATVEQLVGDRPFDRLDRYITQDELRALSENYKAGGGLRAGRCRRGLTAASAAP